MAFKSQTICPTVVLQCVLLLLRVVSDLLQLLELFFLLLDLLLLLRDLGLALLLLHPQFLDDVGVLQLRLGQLFTLKKGPIGKTQHSEINLMSN